MGTIVLVALLWAILPLQGALIPFETNDSKKIFVMRDNLAYCSRVFRDFLADQNVESDERIPLHLSHTDAALFMAALSMRGKERHQWIARLEPNQLISLYCAADQYEIPELVDLIPQLFIQRIRSETIRNRIMIGILPKPPYYPIARLLLARAIVTMPGFLRLPIREDIPPQHWNIALPTSSAISAIRFSADGAYVLGASGYQIHIWRIKTGRSTQILEAPGFIRDIALAANSRHLIGCSGLTIYQWLQDEEERFGDSQVLGYHNYDVVGVSEFPHTPRYALSTGGDGTLKIWDLNVRCHVSEYSIDAPLEHGASISSEGIIATGSLKGILALCDSRDHSPIALYRAYDRGIFPCFSPRGSLAIATEDGRVKLYDIRNLKKALHVQANIGSNDIQALSYTTDGSFCVARTANHSLVIMNGNNLEYIKAFVNFSDRPLATWGMHPRFFRIASNHGRQLLLYTVNAQPAIADNQEEDLLRLIEKDKLSFQQLIMLTTLDTYLEQGIIPSRFFERAQSLYPLHKDLPTIVRDNLTDALALAPPSKGLISRLKERFPFFIHP